MDEQWSNKQELSGGTLGGLSFSLTLLSRGQGSGGLFSHPVELWTGARVGAVVGNRVHREVSLTWAEMMAVLEGPRMLCSAASSCVCRLCWMQGGDQAWPVAPGTGQAVARQLFQMPDLQRHPHRGVHQQVGLSPLSCSFLGLHTLPGCPIWPLPESLVASSFISIQLPHFSHKQHLTHP